MNNKAADPRAIVLIFSALAMALAIMIFYIWIGTAGIENQQNTATANSEFINLDNLLTNAIIESPSKFRGTAIPTQEALTQALRTRYAKVSEMKCEAYAQTTCSFTVHTTEKTKKCTDGYARQILLAEGRLLTTTFEPQQPKIINLHAKVCV